MYASTLLMCSWQLLLTEPGADNYTFRHLYNFIAGEEASLSLNWIFYALAMVAAIPMVIVLGKCRLRPAHFHAEPISHRTEPSDAVELLAIEYPINEHEITIAGENTSSADDDEFFEPESSTIFSISYLYSLPRRIRNGFLGYLPFAVTFGLIDYVSISQFLREITPRMSPWTRIPVSIISGLVSARLYSGLHTEHITNPRSIPVLLREILTRKGLIIMLLEGGLALKIALSHIAEGMTDVGAVAEEFGGYLPEQVDFFLTISVSFAVSVIITVIEGHTEARATLERLISNPNDPSRRRLSQWVIDAIIASPMLLSACAPLIGLTQMANRLYKYFWGIAITEGMSILGRCGLLGLFSLTVVLSSYIGNRNTVIPHLEEIWNVIKGQGQRISENSSRFGRFFRFCPESTATQTAEDPGIALPSSPFSDLSRRKT
jgi:hypothetical protein